MKQVIIYSGYAIHRLKMFSQNIKSVLSITGKRLENINLRCLLIETSQMPYPMLTPFKSMSNIR